MLTRKGIVWVNMPDKNSCHDKKLSPLAKYEHVLLGLWIALTQVILAACSEKTFPIMISGEHSNSIAALKTFQPDSKLGVIWIDAHADIHSLLIPRPRVICIACRLLTACLAEDNPAKKYHKVNVKTQEIWHKIKHLGGIIPKMYPQDLLYIGVRDTEPHEDFLIEKTKSSIFLFKKPTSKV